MSPVYLGNVRRTSHECDHTCHAHNGSYPSCGTPVTVGCSEWFQANLTPQYQEWERRQLRLEGEVMVSLFRRLQIKVKTSLRNIKK